MAPQLLWVSCLWWSFPWCRWPPTSAHAGHWKNKEMDLVKANKMETTKCTVYITRCIMLSYCLDSFSVSICWNFGNTHTILRVSCMVALASCYYTLLRPNQDIGVAWTNACTFHLCQNTWQSRPRYRTCPSWSQTRPYRQRRVQVRQTFRFGQKCMLSRWQDHTSKNPHVSARDLIGLLQIFVA